ncbi:AraC family transcriptional regulator [Cohnella cellulosilytica]|uniref:AraC family transcriptional regulator N-terminal domain-containing protein n=1 Tax=Cohnella cellulosilytica TaxID=986710 RepID=A0ABW2F360_9BACL
MDILNESVRTEKALRQLADLIDRHAPSNGTHPTAIPGLSLLRAIDSTLRLDSVYKPSICVVAQGTKTATAAGETYRYDPSTYLVTGVELPVFGSIVEASPDVPYLSLKLGFETDLVLEVAKHADTPLVDASPTSGIAVNRTSADLLEALVRLMRLLDAPGEIPFMAPLILREIVYRTFQDDQGAILYPFAAIGSHAHGIAQAIRLINRQFDRPLPVEQLARSANMSASAFHKHFKRITAMSPLQYQKTVRLQEARRLMLSEAVPASDAAFRVGYESPSQFSREYARMYGKPPARDRRELSPANRA